MMGTLPSEIGPYRIARKLGEGGMGAVYEAVHQVIQRRVAIKVLHPEAGHSTDTINRFINEARAANLIGHPGLVQITDYGNLPDGSGYLVMEFLAGETLAARLEANGGKLPPEEAVQIGIQIASALSACHKKGIIHRDLKPGNTMLVPDPAMATGERLKILDFGLAKLSEVREAASVKTHSQAVLGTPLYMSPEQCEGAGRVDAKTDVYALGCMLYEMLAGRAPFLGDGPGQVIAQHLLKEPEPLIKLAPQLPAVLADLVTRLLVKSKEERPSMRDTQKALEAVAEGLPAPRRREALDPSGGVNAGALAAVGLLSTLGQGAGETGTPQPRKRPPLPRPLLLGVASLVVVTCSFLAFRYASGPRTPIPVAVPLPAAAPMQVTTRVDTQPAGALVISTTDNQILGKTPWQRQSAPREGKQELTLRLAGHNDQSVLVSLNSDDHSYVVLTPAPPAPTRTRTGSRSKPAPVPDQKASTNPLSSFASKIANKLKRKRGIQPASVSKEWSAARQSAEKNKTR